MNNPVRLVALCLTLLLPPVLGPALAQWDAEEYFRNPGMSNAALNELVRRSATPSTELQGPSPADLARDARAKNRVKELIAAEDSHSWSAARTALKEVVKELGSTPELSAQLGWICLQGGWYKESATALEEAIDGGDASPANHYMAGYAELKLALNDASVVREAAQAAVGHFDRYLKSGDKKTKQKNVLLLRACANWNAGHRDDAQTDYVSASMGDSSMPSLDRVNLATLEAGPPKAQQLASEAFERATAGDVAGALAKLAQSIAIDSHNAQVYTYRGQLLFSQGQSDPALADFNRALELNQTDADAYFGRATIALQKKDLAPALADLNKVIELQPAHAGAHLRLAQLKGSKGDLPGAMAEADKAVELAPASSEASYLRGQLHVALKEPDRAIGDFKKAAELKPDLYEAHAALAQIYLAKQDAANALICLDRMLELKPGEAQALYYRGRVLLALNDWTKALADLAGLAKANPDNVELWTEVGLCQFNTKDYPAAIESFQHLATLTPDKVEVHYALGLLHSLINDRTAAEADFAAAKNPTPAQLDAVIAQIAEQAAAHPENSALIMAGIQLNTQKLTAQLR